MLRVIALLVFVTLGCSACSTKTPELKSPCAGIDGSPCGPKRHVNDAWLKA